MLFRSRQMARTTSPSHTGAVHGAVEACSRILSGASLHKLEARGASEGSGLGSRRSVPTADTERLCGAAERMRECIGVVGNRERRPGESSGSQPRLRGDGLGVYSIVHGQSAPVVRTSEMIHPMIGASPCCPFDPEHCPSISLLSVRVGAQLKVFSEIK